MAKKFSLSYSLLFLSLSLLLLLHPSNAAISHPSSINFITRSCRTTTYPKLCVQSLSTYASAISNNPKQLVTAALTVSLGRAQSTKTFVAQLTRSRGPRPREHAALKDCLEVMSDSVDRLGRSLGELRNMGRARGPQFAWHMSNLQTWVSAALTDYSTCVDGFSGRALDGRVRAAIRARVGNVAQVTSNALALCNRYAGNY